MKKINNSQHFLVSELIFEHIVTIDTLLSLLFPSNNKCNNQK
jgi:hypothetical protein